MMSSANNHEKRLRESMERMKLLKAGDEIDCPLCKKVEMIESMREMGTLLGQLKIVIWRRRAGVSSCRESRHRFLYDSCNCL